MWAGEAGEAQQSCKSGCTRPRSRHEDPRGDGERQFRRGVQRHTQGPWSCYEASSPFKLVRGEGQWDRAQEGRNHSRLLEASGKSRRSTSLDYSPLTRHCPAFSTHPLILTAPSCTAIMLTEDMVKSGLAHRLARLGLSPGAECRCTQSSVPGYALGGPTEWELTPRRMSLRQGTCFLFFTFCSSKMGKTSIDCVVDRRWMNR